MSYPKDLKGQLLARLVPNFDGYVDGMRDKVIWKDARPQPTEAELQAEYDKLVQEQNTEKAKIASALNDLKLADGGKVLSVVELNTVVQALVKLFNR